MANTRSLKKLIDAAETKKLSAVYDNHRDRLSKAQEAVDAAESAAKSKANLALKAVGKRVGFELNNTYWSLAFTRMPNANVILIDRFPVVVKARAAAKLARDRVAAELAVVNADARDLRRQLAFLIGAPKLALLEAIRGFVGE